LFRLVDSSGVGYIDTFILNEFMKKNSKYLSEVELEGVLWRLGHRHTGRVTYAEFVHALSVV